MSFALLRSILRRPHTMRVWRNWQTRWLQVPVGATSWGFESLHPHQQKSDRSRNGPVGFYRGWKRGFEPREGATVRRTVAHRAPEARRCASASEATRLFRIPSPAPATLRRSSERRFLLQSHGCTPSRRVCCGLTYGSTLRPCKRTYLAHPEAFRFLPERNVRPRDLQLFYRGTCSWPFSRSMYT